jgi:hypothetical protein
MVSTLDACCRLKFSGAGLRCSHPLILQKQDSSRSRREFVSGESGCRRIAENLTAARLNALCAAAQRHARISDSRLQGLHIRPFRRSVSRTHSRLVARCR